MDLLTCETIEDWRAWLQGHQAGAKEIWLVYFKKESGRPGLDYQDTLDEALCYGWIDSLIKKLDDNSYCRKFTPRKAESNWSAANKGRVGELIAAGRMTPAGLALVEAAQANGCWERPERTPINDQMPEEFAAALAQNPIAHDFFESLPHTAQREYVIWVAMAKRPATRQAHIEEALRLLAAGRRLGLR